MNEPSSYSYVRYLAAKSSVDERSISRRVWTAFLQLLVDRESSPLRILELGGGIGTTLQRIITELQSRDVKKVEYTFVDIESTHIQSSRKRLLKWADRRGFTIDTKNRKLTLRGPITVSVRLINADVLEFASASTGPYDAIVAQALLDLFSISEILDTLRPLLAPEGLWYLPTHFDGVTAFEPPIDEELEATIERLYHESMVEEKGGGRHGARSGRRLLSHFSQSQATLRTADSSDWIVFARGDEYPEDEAYFLNHILHFIEEELSDHPSLDHERFEWWIRKRRREIENGELIYVAHQLDVLAQEP